MSIFDDDEEDPPIAFEQDPESDDIGEGYWTRKSGERVYAAGDPQEAQRLMAKTEAPPMPETGPLSAEESAGLEVPQSDIDQLEKGVEALSGTPEASEEPKPPDAQPAAAPAAPASAPPLSQGGLPALPGARGPSRFTDSVGASESQSSSQNASDTVSRTGSAQDRGQFEAQQGEIERGYQGQQQAQDAGAQNVVGALQKRRDAIMQMAADKEAATSAVQASAEARKAQVIKKTTEVSARPTDLNKIWKDKGALGTTLGLLGVALRSLTATKFGGPNTALQSLQEQKRQNIQAQLDDRNSELRGLEKELGSIEAAAPMLEARMNDALGKRIDAMMLDEKSATVLANAKTMKEQLATESALKKAEAAKAYYGTLATQQARQATTSQTQGTEQGRQRLSGAGVGGEGARPATAADVLKERLAARDLQSLGDTTLTHDEFQKENTDYREKAGKQNEFKSSLDALSKELGVSVTRNDDGTVTVNGEPDVGLLPSEKKRKIDAAFARLKRADVMSMTREPSADLQDEFGGLADRPFWDDEIVPKLQRFYEMHGQLQKDLDGGYNPAVVRAYRKSNDITNKPKARPVTGAVNID